MVMSELPPMPKPSEFGITEEDWRHDLCCHESRRSYSRNPFGKVEAYFNALDAWKEAAKVAARRADISR
jgi:hypothetical protein